MLRLCKVTSMSGCSALGGVKVRVHGVNLHLLLLTSGALFTLVGVQ